MDDAIKAEAARQFSQAADMLVDACRKLEQHGMADPPVERLLQALEAVTHQVHQLYPPPERLQFEAADLAGPMAYRLAAHLAVRGEGDPPFAESP